MTNAEALVLLSSLLTVASCSARDRLAGEPPPSRPVELTEAGGEKGVAGGNTPESGQRTPGHARGDWSDYRNAEFGFALRFPGSFALLEDEPDETGAVLARVRLVDRRQRVSSVIDQDPGRFAVVVYDNPAGLSPEEWLNAEGWPFAAASRWVAEAEVDGRPALEVGTGLMLAPNRYLYVAAGRAMLRIMPLAEESPAIVESFEILP